MKTRYSICITCKNNVNFVRASLESILNQIDDKFEVVVVDAESCDGTLRVLQEYANKGSIKLIVSKCSRGRGRQIAFENSKGDYIIANMDLDDIFAPRLLALINFYHNKCEGKILRAVAVREKAKVKQHRQNITLGPKWLIRELGGWRDLQYLEEWDLWARAAKVGRFAWTAFPVIKVTNPHFERNRIMSKISLRFVIYRESIRLGRPVFVKGEKPKLNQKLILTIAKIAALFKTNFRDDFNKTFDSFDLRYYII